MSPNRKNAISEPRTTWNAFADMVSEARCGSAGESRALHVRASPTWRWMVVKSDGPSSAFVIAKLNPRRMYFSSIFGHLFALEPLGRWSLNVHDTRRSKVSRGKRL